MLADPIARAYRTAGSLPGGVAVREFAAREFPNEDPAWIASQARRTATPWVGGRASWGRFRRWLGTPGETEPASEPTAEPVPA